MNNIILDNLRHVHFVGVGGISMHLLAMYCKDLGIDVSGSDIRKSKYTEKCKKVGIKIHIGHRRKNIDCADLIVCTGAVDNTNVEIKEAIKRKIKVVDRAEFLASICKRYKHVIGVAGTHGKTTTCAMIYHILKQCGKNVSCHIGADVDGAQMKSTDEYLVLECCEYNRSFLRLYYNVAVVLNIDNDHLDCYQNMYNLRNAFKTFLKRAKTRFVFDNPTTKCIKNKCERIKVGNVLDSNKFIYNNRRYVLDNVYGKHNLNNAMVAVAVAYWAGLKYTKIYKALKTFKPAGRRCEMLANVNGVDIITDYAHHPTEIENVYNSLRLKYNNIYLIFQPHTYSRTKLLLHEFVGLFSGIDNIIIYKEYSARESKGRGYSARQLCEYLDNAVYVKNLKQVKECLAKIKFEVNACIAFIGAGNINLVADKWVKQIRKGMEV